MRGEPVDVRAYLGDARGADVVGDLEQGRGLALRFHEVVDGLAQLLDELVVELVLRVPVLRCPEEGARRVWVSGDRRRSRQARGPKAQRGRSTAACQNSPRTRARR